MFLKLFVDINANTWEDMGRRPPASHLRKQPLCLCIFQGTKTVMEINSTDTHEQYSPLSTPAPHSPVLS